LESLEIKVAFETGAFATTQETWKKAFEDLGIQNTDGRIHFKRIGKNQIQIFQYDEVDKKTNFKSSANHKTKIIASFTCRAIGSNKKRVRLKS
tara:strand:+ start:413 stop:691 length:279 start_codon:yes stop_codon:yes gene_type:complete